MKVIHQSDRITANSRTFPNWFPTMVINMLILQMSSFECRISITRTQDKAKSSPIITSRLAIRFKTDDSWIRTCSQCTEIHWRLVMVRHNLVDNWSWMASSSLTHHQRLHHTMFSSHWLCQLATRKTLVSTTTSCTRQLGTLAMKGPLCQDYPVTTSHANRTILPILAMTCNFNLKPSLIWMKLSTALYHKIKWMALREVWKCKIWYEWASKMLSIWTTVVEASPHKTTWTGTRPTSHQIIAAIITRDGLKVDTSK